MIENLPTYISIVFGLTAFTTLVLFYWSVKNSPSEKTKSLATKILIGGIVWLTIQASLSLTTIYNSNTDSIPPKIVAFGIFPIMLSIIFLFTTKKGREFIDSLPLASITYIHTVRIPVEIVLFWLFVNKAVPELMTFEGRNFDIAAGISAPFIVYFGFIKGKINKTLILIWNFICLGLLLNIVVNAVLASPFPFQQFAFDQPNIAVLNFPFVWLPTFIVPIVLFGHLVSIRQLRNTNN
ncbi:MAG: hypothetical protein IPJ32_19795 [Sphingobacteriaceae bacterium]|nr:hypothetical protein [Sphingobacteriaceae bacterium]